MIVYLVTAVKLETFGTVVNKLFKMLKERLFKFCVAVKTSRRRKVRIVNIIVVIPDYLVRLYFVSRLTFFLIGKVVLYTEPEAEME